MKRTNKVPGITDNIRRLFGMNGIFFIMWNLIFISLLPDRVDIFYIFVYLYLLWNILMRGQDPAKYVSRTALTLDVVVLVLANFFF